MFTKIYHRLVGSVERAQGSQRVAVLLVFFSIFLDNLLLTAVGMYVHAIFAYLILKLY